ncbi:TRAP transporter substrate-binding protein [Desulfuromonas sp. AOP6]|uniref:TRAP transporter substrate-binding protein n=1 Tax=Desulfuromonas sp. AOP6 TaxID=1566351 RepID=UPI00128483DF|nr:TRAP transporter substrate-binding protein [Desulfuromonas sp. AOP6]BCA81151.1 C4-dicarboxylate-binding periplasmic protein DctP [Desulfuromonas sp. AOP6]
MKKFSSLLLTLVALTWAGTALAADPNDPLAAWKPAFDPKGAEYTYILSNVSHPAIEGVGVGYRIRDKVWERSGGRLFVDFRPLSQLGGEKDVISKLKMGAIQGMLSSSVAAANVSDKLGIVNLPYVVDSFDKLDRFRQSEELFGEFKQSALSSGIMVVDITGYGTYGWATTTPVRNLEDAKKVNFRIAQAPVNTDIYKSWGLKFTVMPWPDVPQALQTGVINGLDHTPIVCNITKKFDVAKYFTQVDYAQGLFVHLMNKRWFDKLPQDLQTVLIDVIEEESAASRDRTRTQHDEQVAAAKAKGVEFFALSAEDRARLVEMAAPVYESWGAKIGPDYLQKVRTVLGP